MGHSLVLKGRGGCLKAGYQVAATVGAFTLTPAGTSEWHIEAALAEVDEFWVAQPVAQVLELAVGQQRWTWRDVALVVDGTTVRGIVRGSPDRR